MRFIDLDKVATQIDETWLLEAEKLKKEIIDAKDIKAKKKIIDDNSDFWGKLKALLASQSNHKCWYTDSQVVFEEGQIDHFRPKSGVLGLRHDGYWWLAFDFENFRYTRRVANSRIRTAANEIDGKGTYFKIFDEATRCYTPEGDLDLEKPYLIDPCCASDVRLIMFADNGEAAPRYNKDEKPFENQRAKESIRAYGIGNRNFFMSRRDLGIKLARLLKESDGHASKGDVENLRLSIDRISRIISQEKEFSSFSRAYIRAHSVDRDYLMGLMEVI